MNLIYGYLNIITLEKQRYYTYFDQFYQYEFEMD